MKTDKEFFPMFNAKVGKYEVHCRDGCIIDDLSSFDCARYIAELACLGHIWINGDEIRIAKDSMDELLAAQTDSEYAKPVACPPPSQVTGG